MKTKRVLAIVISMIMVMGLFSMTAYADDDPEVTLRYATHLANTGITGERLVAWLDAITEQSGGSIKIDPYWSASLVSPASAYSETVMGITDMETQAPGNEIDHFVVETAITYMYLGQGTMQQRINAAHKVFESVEDYQKEYDEVEVLTFGGAGEEFCIFSKKPIQTLEDLKGLNIRVMDQYAFDLMLDFGAAPVKMPLGQMYESIEKGVIDAILLCSGNYLSENLADYVDYMTYIGIGASPCVWSYINKGVYDGLTENQQNVLKETSKTYGEEALIEGVWTVDAGADAEADGKTIYHFSEEDTAALIAQAEANALEQIEALNAAGYDGQAIYDTVRAAMEEELAE